MLQTEKDRWGHSCYLHNKTVFSKKGKKFTLFFLTIQIQHLEKYPFPFTEKYHPTEAIYHTDWSKMKCLHSNAAGSWAGFTGVVWNPAALHCAARPHCHLPSWVSVSQAWSHSQPLALRLLGGSFPVVQRSPRFSVEVLTHTSHFAQAFSSQIAQAPVWDIVFPIPMPLLSFSLSKVSVLLFKMFLFVDKVSLTRTISPSTPLATCLS